MAKIFNQIGLNTHPKGLECGCHPSKRESIKRNVRLMIASQMVMKGVQGAQL